ncbi:putative reverse transcriptase domain-containing protein [Tanacetum coccineum]
MAYTSQGLSSSLNFNSERDALKKSNLEIIGYQLGLESLEARIVVHQKNEAVYEEDIAFLKYDVKPMNENELHDCHLNKIKVFKTASDSSVNEIEEENNQVNDSVPRIESTTSKSSKDSLEQPKDVRPSAPIIEEWESDSDDDCVIRPSFEQNKHILRISNCIQGGNPTKIDSIKDWASPKTSIEIHQFLEVAFQLLKQKLCSAPILFLPEELGAVVFALKMWRRYLYGTKWVVFNDHKILHHILDQKELNMRQRRCLELMSDYDFEIRYHPGKANMVADALSRKE